MLNIELIQADTENVRNAIQRRGDTFSIDELVSLDNKRKLIQKELDNLSFSDYLLASIDFNNLSLPSVESWSI